MTTCAGHFVNSLLTDIGVDLVERVIIEAKLLRVFNTFQNDRSKVSISEITQELIQCLQPALDSTTFLAQQIAYAIFFVLLITAIFIILIATVLYILVDSRRGGVLIGIWVVFLILYLIAVTLILFNAGNNIALKIEADTALVTACVNKAITEFDTFLNINEQAIQTALCAY